MQQLAHAESMDQTTFWHLVNKRKSFGKQRTCPIDLGDGKIVSKPEEVRTLWKEHFENLYNPHSSPHFDNDFKEHIEKCVKEMEVLSHSHEPFLLKEHFTVDEVKQVCAQMKNRKAPGFDKICAENLKYGGPYLLKVITFFFNRITSEEHIPPDMKKGIVVPIPKGTKDPTQMDNNRGITLIPVISKVYEKLLLARYEKWTGKANTIDCLQGAAQKNCSSTHTSWLLRESIAHNIEFRDTVYVGLLDTSKAFDTVWTQGMFYKLYKTGIDTKLWRILREFYKDFSCCVCIAGKMSVWFTTKQGVHQGAPWSMELFQMANNDLLVDLKLCGRGCCVEHLQTGNPAFADDIAVACLHKSCLQYMFNQAYSFSCKWRFNFNAGKTEVIIFGPDKCPSKKVIMGNTEVAVLQGSKHMGVPLTPGRAYRLEQVQGKITKANKVLYAILGLGSHRVPVTTVAASHLYWSNYIPMLMHGMEIAELTPDCVSALEQAHGSAAKVIQGLPQQAANGACLASLGWCSLETYLDKLKMTFLWRLLVLPMSSIYKQLVLIRLCYHIYYAGWGKHLGPVQSMLDTFAKYDLTHMVIDGIESGTYMPIAMFKRLIASKVNESEQKRFKVTCLLYQTLDLYSKCIFEISIWPWWVYAHIKPEHGQPCRLLLKLIYGHSGLGCHVSKFSNESALCKLCHDNSYESVCHMLFCCKALNAKRLQLWTVVENASPTALVTEFRAMNINNKAEFILSGLMCKFVPEWEELYTSLLIYVTELYKLRSQLNSTE